MKKALIFDCYDDFNIRIQYIQKALKLSGYDVKTYFSDFNHNTKDKYEVYRDNIQYIPTRKYKKNLSIERMYSHHVFAKDCAVIAENENDVDLIYVMAPPNSMVQQFAKYKRNHPNVKVWVEVFDMWPESLPISSNIKTIVKPILNGWKNRRDKYIHEVDYVSAECNLFKDVLEKHIDSNKIETIYICQDAKPVDHSRKLEDTIHFLYCGSINHLINIELICKFLSALQKKRKLSLNIIGDGENRDKFLKALDEYQIPYIYYGFVYDEKKKKAIYQKSHFGLNLMKNTVFVGLTMKSLDYFSHELPIINNIVKDSYDLVENDKIGYNLSLKTIDNIVNELSSLDQESYQKMEQSTKEVFDKNFDSNIVLEQLQQLIHKIEQQ